MALTTEIILHFHFHFKVFSKREKERERAREKEDRAPIQSDDRRRTSRSSPRRSHEFQSDDRNPRLRSREALRQLRLARCFTRSCRRSRSRLHKIALSIAIDGTVVGLELTKHHVVKPSWASIVDDFFPRFCPCFSGFIFSFFFSKHQKIFFGKFFEMQPNAWKHFPFRKIAFPENGIFSENAFTRTKHSLSLLKSKPLYQPLRWCGKAPPNFVWAFPKMGSSQFLLLSLTLKCIKRIFILRLQICRWKETMYDNAMY